MVKRLMLMMSLIFLGMTYTDMAYPLRNSIQRLIIGKWSLYQVKVMNQKKPAPSDFRYSIQFSGDGSITIQENEINSTLSENHPSTDTGVYKLSGRNIFITLHNGKKMRMRIYQVKRKNLILRINGNHQYRYLFFFLKRSV